MTVSERTVTVKQVTLTKDELVELICDSSAEELAVFCKSIEIVSNNKIVNDRFVKLMIEFNTNVASRVIENIFKEEQ